MDLGDTFHPLFQHLAQGTFFRCLAAACLLFFFLLSLAAVVTLSGLFVVSIHGIVADEVLGIIIQMSFQKHAFSDHLPQVGTNGLFFASALHCDLADADEVIIADNPAVFAEAADKSAHASAANDHPYTAATAENAENACSQSACHKERTDRSQAEKDSQKNAQNDQNEA